MLSNNLLVLGLADSLNILKSMSIMSVKMIKLYLPKTHIKKKKAILFMYVDKILLICNLEEELTKLEGFITKILVKRLKKSTMLF